MNLISDFFTHILIVLKTLQLTKLQSSTNGTYEGTENPDAVAGAQSFQTSLPFYPSPWMTPGTTDWADAYEKATAFVAQLTLLEKVCEIRATSRESPIADECKVNITTGVGWESEQCVGQTGSVPRLSLRSMCMQDSPVGVRNTDYNSVFSSGQSVAATFDRGLFYQRGYAMGKVSNH